MYVYVSALCEKNINIVQITLSVSVYINNLCKIK